MAVRRRMIMPLPQDPALLLSVINTKLRDKYASFADLCEDLNVSAKEIEEKLNRAGYFYRTAENRFA